MSSVCGVSGFSSSVEMYSFASAATIFTLLFVATAVFCFLFSAKMIRTEHVGAARWLAAPLIMVGLLALAIAPMPGVTALCMWGAM